MSERRRQQAAVWAGRVLWAALPLALGPALGDALHDWSINVRTTASIYAWGVWAAVLLATLVPHPIALTGWRIVAPGAALVSAWCALDGHTPAVGALVAVAAAAVAYSAAVGSHFVNGPAYGDERRYPLRPPGVVLLGPVVVAWAATVALPTTGVLLLADSQWVAGGVAAIVGAIVAAAGSRALLGLARRWLVFVPAGLVVHDPLGLADPVLFTRRQIAAVGPAPAQGNGALDLTANALGLALQLDLTDPATVVAITHPGRRPEAGAIDVDRVLVTPTRAAAVLADAAARGYAIG